MSQRIHKLSPLLINQIAAGEVVTRPASVVKELLENAIDSGASHITVHIEQGGLGLIQISDNGHGIHPDDMTLAVTRHATSKLADVGELAGIDSLGFRGEALASIAAVSHLTLTSSPDDTGIGQQLTLSGNAVSDISQATIRPVVKNRGTTVSARDLYYNVPARRANLKSIATEFAQIEQVIQRLAISFADIGLELYHQHKLRFSLNSLSQKTHLTRLENALNLPLEAIATPFELSLNALQPLDNQAAKITGWLFLTSQGIELPKLIYINQRLVSDLAISQTIAKSARQVGLDNANLGYALFFDLPKDWINVNIHPSKQQVKIQPLSNILALLNQALQDTLKTKFNENTVQMDILQVEKNPALEKTNTVKNDSQASQTLNYPNQSLKNSAFQVSENQLTYEFAEVKKDNFSPKPLFDDSPKFLKIMGKGEKGLIFWQDNFYAVTLELLTQEVLTNKNAFENLLRGSEILNFTLSDP